MENAVRDNKQERRFEMTLDAGKTALIEYEEAGAGVLALTHAEVPEEYEGRGIGSRLVKETFEILQAEGLKILPLCPFVAAYLRRHPEYQSLVARGRREREPTPDDHLSCESERSIQAQHECRQLRDRCGSEQSTARPKLSNTEDTMMRRVLLVSAALLCSVAASGSVGAQQQDFSRVEIKTTPVAGSVYMLEGAGGNIGVSAGADGVLIVDDQFAPLAEKIRAALRGINPGALRFVLNTHWHGDHTGGNIAFGREASIIAHTNVRKRLATESRVRGNTVPTSPKEALPVITFDETLSIHFNGEEIRAVHFPHGHTDGDLVIYFTKSNVIHLGDHFFRDRFPFVDLDNGGTVQGLTENIGKVLSRLPAGVKIIPGHGPLSAPADLRRYHAMLVETTEVVRDQIAAGKTLEQTKAAGLPTQYREWGTGFMSSERWIETIYGSLQQQREEGTSRD